ncbi:MAG: alpha/beta fold hydrolase [Thermodesulfobacteriota bacterium]
MPGPATGIVFLPGWGFDVQVASLAGLSGVLGPEGFLDPASLVPDLASGLDAWGPAPVHLVGWSLGGYLALSFAQAQPARVASLTLVGMRASWPAAEIDALAARFQADPADFLAWFRRLALLGLPAGWQRFQELPALPLDAEARKRLLAGLSCLAGRIPRPVAGIPTRILHGAKDRIAPPAEALSFPGCPPRLLPRAGHLPFLRGLVGPV